MKYNITKQYTIVKQWWQQATVRNKVISIAVVLVIFLVIKNLLSPADTSGVETIERQTLERTIKASGSVVSSTDLALAFQQSKSIKQINVSVGDLVKKGQILATLENGTERAAVTSARGALLAAEARYKKVLEGSSNEEVQLAQVKLNNAKKQNDTFVENARRAMLSGGLEAVPDSSVSASASPIISGTYTGVEGEYRLSFKPSFNEQVIRYSGIENGTTRINKTTPQPLGTKGLFIVFPSSAEFNDEYRWTVTIPNSESATYVANYNAYTQSIEDRAAAIATAEAELALKRATARQPDIDAALADVITAQAGLEDATARLEQTILRAPADGTITKVESKVGEVPKALEPVMTLEDVSNLYLEADVNESSVSLLALDQPVTVTFDAFGPNKTYDARISSIDPSATITDGIVNYKVKALLSAADGIRPGMTANMTVVAFRKADVLAIPGRSVTRKGDVATVLVVTGTKRISTAERVVTLGTEGDGDLFEVLSGLSDGERIMAIAE